MGKILVSSCNGIWIMNLCQRSYHCTFVSHQDFSPFFFMDELKRHKIAMPKDWMETQNLSSTTMFIWSYLGNLCKILDSYGQRRSCLKEECFNWYKFLFVGCRSDFLKNNMHTISELIPKAWNSIADNSWIYSRGCLYINAKFASDNWLWYHLQ